MNKQEIEQTIANVEQQLASLKAELLKSSAHEKWNPGGEWIITAEGTVFDRYTDNERVRDFCSYFPTKDAAESALASRRLFNRMQCLAAELNPSGKVGGKYHLLWICEKQLWYADYWEYHWCSECLFETCDAAQSAAEIFNRDGVRPPPVEAEK